MDFNAYLASSSDEDEPQEGDGNTNDDHDSSEDEDKKIDKYKVSVLKIQKKSYDLFAKETCFDILMSSLITTVYVTT